MIENSRDTVSLSTRRNFLHYRKSGKFRVFFKYRYVPVLLTPAALRCDFGYGPCIVAFKIITKTKFRIENVSVREIQIVT